MNDQLVRGVLALTRKEKKNDFSCFLNSSQQSTQNPPIMESKTNSFSKKPISMDLTPKLKSKRLKGLNELIIHSKQKDNNDCAITDSPIKTLSLFYAKTERITKSKTARSKRVTFQVNDLVDIIEIVSFKKYNKLPLNISQEEMEKDRDKELKVYDKLKDMPHECKCILI